MAVNQLTTPSDPTQERFAETVLFLDHALSVLVDRVLWVVDCHPAKAERLAPRA
jgi:hypothetical protein